MFYCATHKDEDLNALRGERLDSLTEHMVAHKSWTWDAINSISDQYVIWEMVKRPDGFFYFGQLADRA